MRWLLKALPLICCMVSVSADGGECSPLTPAALAERLQNEPSKSLAVVFFSAWCSDCAVHLKSLKNANTLLIGAFDKKERVEKIVQKLGLKNPCFTDAGVAARLGVKVVPATRTLNETDIAVLQR